MRVHESIEFMDDQEGVSKEEFDEFWRLLPSSYVEKWKKLNKTFEDIAGDDGIIDMREFDDFVDDFLKM